MSYTTRAFQVLILVVCCFMDELKRDLWLENVIWRNHETGLDAFRMLILVHLLSLGFSLVGAWTVLRLHWPNVTLVLHVVRTISLFLLLNETESSESSTLPYVILYVLNAREYLFVEFFAPHYRTARLLDVSCYLTTCFCVHLYRENVAPHPLRKYDYRASLCVFGLTLVNSLKLALFYARRGCAHGTIGRRQQSGSQQSGDSDFNYAASAPPLPSGPSTAIVLPSHSNKLDNFEANCQRMLETLSSANTSRMIAPGQPSAPMTDHEAAIEVLLEITERIDSSFDDDSCCSPNTCKFVMPTPSSVLVPPVFAPKQQALPGKMRLGFHPGFYLVALIVSYACREVVQQSLVIYVMYYAYAEDAHAAFHVNFYLLVHYGTAILVDLFFASLNVSKSPHSFKVHSSLWLFLSVVFNVSAGLLMVLKSTSTYHLCVLAAIAAVNEPMRSAYAYPYLYRRAMDHGILAVLTAFGLAFVSVPFFVWRVRLFVLPVVCAVMQAALFFYGLCGVSQD
jgi:hypothetical protein